MSSGYVKPQQAMRGNVFLGLKQGWCCNAHWSKEKKSSVIHRNVEDRSVM